MKNILMVIHNLSFTNGGITKVMLNRTHIFKNLGYNSNLVTFDPDQDYEDLEVKFKECGRLHKDSKIINLFSYFSKKNTKNISILQDNELSVYEKNYLIQDEYIDSKKFSRYFDTNGVLIKCKYWNNTNIERIEYYEKNSVNKIKFYRKNLHYKTVYLDTNGNDIIIKYYTPDGFCFFQRSFLGENRLLHIFIFDRDTKKVIGFNSYKKLHTYFLECLCIEKDRINNIVICDGPGSAEKVASISSKKALKILTIHSNHLSKPFISGSPIKEGIQTTLNNINNVDTIIILTKSQLYDLVNQFGNAEKFYYIPNTIDYPENFNKKDYTTDVKTINIISRYVKMKNHEHVIHAISKIKNKIPKNSLKVNFYGEGENKENLIKLVNELNLNSIITINNYITNTNEKFRNADLTIFTSSYEGFGLTIIESMSNKTPVISYDIKYGPKDIISHNIDGLLVRYNDIETLSNYIYENLFSNNGNLQKLSENSFSKIRAEFTHKNAEVLWKNLLENIIS